MLTRAAKLIRHPRRYVPLLLKRLQQRMTPLFRNTAFFFQGQMDVSPRSPWYNERFVRETGGFFPPGGAGNREICTLEAWDNTRRDMLVLLLRSIVTRGIEGDFAELGVYKGDTATLLHYYAPERVLHLFDTFEGFTERSVAAERERTSHDVHATHFADTSLDAVKARIAQKNDSVRFYQGYFPDSIPRELVSSVYAFVHLDADLFEPIIEGLRFFYPRMQPGGFIVVHDYNAWPGSRKAVDDFFADKPEIPVPMPDKSGSALIVKL